MSSLQAFFDPDDLFSQQHGAENKIVQNVNIKTTLFKHKLRQTFIKMSSKTLKVDTKVVDDIKNLLWGTDLKDEVFTRWTQGFLKLFYAYTYPIHNLCRKVYCVSHFNRSLELFSLQRSYCFMFKTKD